MYDDLYLIKKIRGGNYNAFGLLINKYQNYVYAILRQLLKSNEDAEEAYQDTFMKVYRSLESYNEKAKFSSWLYRIAYNTGLDYLKKKKRTTELIDNIENQGDGHHNGQETRDLKRILRKLVRQLPQEEAVIITLFYFEENTVKEIAEITGISESNIKTKLFRARKKMRAMIPEEKENELKSYYHE